MRRLISAFLLSLSLLAASAGALAQVGSEQQLKAAFIVNFLKYVEWPEANRGASICLFGRDTLGANLASFEGRTVGGYELVIRRVPLLPFTITITATGCAAGPDVPTRTMPARLPPPAFSYVDGAWTVRVDQRTPALAPEARPQPVQPTAALIDERGGAVRWRRTLTVAAVGPCALP